MHTYCCIGSNPVVINYAPKPVSVDTVRIVVYLYYVHLVIFVYVSIVHTK